MIATQPIATFSIATFEDEVIFNPPSIPGLEYTEPINRLHYSELVNLLNFSEPVNRLHYTMEDEN